MMCRARLTLRVSARADDWLLRGGVGVVARPRLYYLQSGRVVKNWCCIRLDGGSIAVKRLDDLSAGVEYHS